MTFVIQSRISVQDVGYEGNGKSICSSDVVNDASVTSLMRRMELMLVVDDSSQTKCRHRNCITCHTTHDRVKNKDVNYDYLKVK